VYDKLGQNEAAIECSLKAVEIKKFLYGELHNEVALLFFNIGSFYFCSEEYHKALEYLLKALNIYRNLNGENHENTAFSYLGVAGIFWKLEDYQKTIVYSQKARDIYTVISQTNPDGVDIASSQGQLAFANERIMACQKILDRQRIEKFNIS